MNIDQQVEYLMQGTEYGDDATTTAMALELRERLVEAEKEGRNLKVYCGYDPRTTDLHIGHTVTMRKLRQFQELGHEVFFVIGTYTSLIGDPSDKNKLRPLLTTEEVSANAQTYAEQAFRILDKDKTKVVYNAEWLSKLTFADLIKLASNFTIQQFLTRENFRNRWDDNEAVYVHELFYAIMQGYDAHALDVDVQVGGTDQLFNIMTASRKIMSYFDQKPNIGIILAILPGTDGDVKMSKSLGNHIPLNSSPEDMYGKVMSVPDRAMDQYAKLVTRWTPNQITNFSDSLKKGSIHPRDAKMLLAHEIVSAFYGEKEADKAQDYFVTLFQKGNLPDEIPTFSISTSESILDVLQEAGLISSKSQGRRLLDQKGIKVDGVVISDPTLMLDRNVIVQVGKRQFLQVLIN
ncbi:MAG: tyrosine--tRNA ligase [Anaerolineaceae bacterium]|nr:tyrosine--tRNA ligase [Anaerolineaceae bacterium]